MDSNCFCHGSKYNSSFLLLSGLLTKGNCTGANLTTWHLTFVLGSQDEHEDSAGVGTTILVQTLCGTLTSTEDFS